RLDRRLWKSRESRYLKRSSRRGVERDKRMTPEAQALKTQLEELSTEDRAELAFYLIHSLDQIEDPEAEDAWDAELARRGEEIRAGVAVGEPAASVFARLRARYS